MSPCPSFHLSDETHHSDGEVIVEDGVGYAIAWLRILVHLLMGDDFDLPSVHHDGRRPADFPQDLVDGFPFVAAAPSEAAGQIVARP